MIEDVSHIDFTAKQMKKLLANFGPMPRPFCFAFVDKSILEDMDLKTITTKQLDKEAKNTGYAETNYYCTIWFEAEDEKLLFMLKHYE